MSQLLFLMRHGQTIFNVQHRIQGWCDSPLTIEGQNQAKRVKQYFKEHHITFDHVYSSTSERCCDTLELITDMPYTRLKGLKEMFYGELEGESERLNCKTPKECETYYLQFGGESSNDVRDRMVKTLKDIMDKEDHYNVLAVSHGGACYSFLSCITDPNIVRNQGGFTNCCILHFKYENGKFEYIEIMRP